MCVMGLRRGRGCLGLVVAHQRGTTTRCIYDHPLHMGLFP
jgi:hypothetical protein